MRHHRCGVRVLRFARPQALGQTEHQLHPLRQRDDAVPDRHQDRPRGLQPVPGPAPPELHRRQCYPRRQHLQHRAAVRGRACRGGADRRGDVHPQEHPLALSFGAYHQRREVCGGATHGAHQRRGQHYCCGHPVPTWQARAVPYADTGQAIRALRGGLPGRERRSDPSRSAEHVVAAAVQPHVLQVHRIADHAALHRERHLEHPRPGEGDDDGAGRVPDRAPGGSLPPQQQAHAAAQRPHRAVLPPVLEEQDQRDAIGRLLVDARPSFGDDDAKVIYSLRVFGFRLFDFCKSSCQPIGSASSVRGYTICLVFKSECRKFVCVCQWVR